MIKNQSALGTLASEIKDKTIYENQNIVKITTVEKLDRLNFPEATNFMRKVLIDTKNIYHHLGVYCYQKETLKNFVSFNQSVNELKNKLEQLRALDNNIKINVAQAKNSPIGVDTEEDFLAIKKIMEYKYTFEPFPWTEHKIKHKPKRTKCDNFITYPYFEKDIYNLKEKGYII